MSQQEVLKILKNIYISGNLGWFSTRQIRKICFDYNLELGLNSLNDNLKKLYLAKFIDRVPNNRGFLYRYRNPNKNKLFT